MSKTFYGGVHVRVSGFDEFLDDVDDILKIQGLTSREKGLLDFIATPMQAGAGYCSYPIAIAVEGESKPLGKTFNQMIKKFREKIQPELKCIHKKLGLKPKLRFSVEVVCLDM